jgi:hypothetical protein
MAAKDLNFPLPQLNPTPLVPLGNAAQVDLQNIINSLFIVAQHASDLEAYFNYMVEHNNVTVIAAKNINYTPPGVDAIDRTVESKLREVVSATDFGVVGDDSTDNTDALYDWFQELGSGNYEGTIVGARCGYLPPGKYRYSDGAAINLVGCTSIIGVPYNSILKPNSSVNVAMTMGSGSQMSGIVLDGVNTSGKIGLQLGASSLVTGITIRDCNFARFRGTNGLAVDIQNVVSAYLDNITTSDNYNGLKVFYNDPSSTPTVLLFNKYYAKANSNRGVWIKSGTQICFIQPTIELNGAEGLYLNQETDLVENVSILGGYFEANQQNIASGGARNATYQVFVTGNGVKFRDTYFYGNTNEAKAINLDSALDYVLDGIYTPHQAAQILTSGTSLGVISNWHSVNNGSIDTAVSNTSSNVANPSLIYEEHGNWTPVLHSAATDDIATGTAYSTQLGKYSRKGKTYKLHFVIQCNLVYATAAGNIRITGFPGTPAAALDTYLGSLSFQGITKATYTNFNVAALGGLTYLQLYASGSGVTKATVTMADIPSGTTVILTGELEFTLA